MKRLDLVGKKFGRLTVVAFGYIKDGRVYWKCKCNCGKDCTIVKNSLISGNTRSCGCMIKEINITHGMRKTSFYHKWTGIKTRCLNKNDKNYQHYGLLGIKICNRWLKFENFRNDMYNSYLSHAKQYGEKNTTIDRINNHGGYSLKNCRWATYNEQANNKTNNCFLTYNNETLTLSQWAEKTNIKLALLYSRMNTLHWSAEKILTTTPRKNIKFITYNNITLSVMEWAKKMDLNYNTLRNRISLHKWSIEKSLTTPINIKCRNSKAL